MGRAKGEFSNLSRSAGTNKSKRIGFLSKFKSQERMHKNRYRYRLNRELWIELIIKKGFSKNPNETAVTNYPKNYKRMTRYYFPKDMSLYLLSIKRSYIWT